MEEPKPSKQPDLFRCDIPPCGHIITEADISTHGSCPNCGGRRVRIANAVTDDEYEALIAGGYKFDERWRAKAQLTQ